MSNISNVKTPHDFPKGDKVYVLLKNTGPTGTWMIEAYTDKTLFQSAVEKAHSKGETSKSILLEAKTLGIKTSVSIE